jgi:hypothetical protein
MSIRCLAVVLVLCAPSLAAAQGSPSDPKAFHDTVVAVMGRLASRPMTPGDTFVTWSPNPGGLLHTTAIEAMRARTSLLRLDGMLGTAETRWRGATPEGFESVWTRRGGKGAEGDSAANVRGTVAKGMVDVTAGTLRRQYPVPAAEWTIADIGMEELMIPMLLAYPSSERSHAIAVFRPYHLRWDTLAVTVRVTDGLRTAEFCDKFGTHDLMAISTDNQLLWQWRFDDVSERRPLETSARFRELIERQATIRDLLPQVEPNLCTKRA